MMQTLLMIDVYIAGVLPQSNEARRYPIALVAGQSFGQRRRKSAVDTAVSIASVENLAIDQDLQCVKLAS